MISKHEENVSHFPVQEKDIDHVEKGKAFDPFLIISR